MFRSLVMVREPAASATELNICTLYTITKPFRARVFKLKSPKLLHRHRKPEVPPESHRVGAAFFFAEAKLAWQQLHNTASLLLLRKEPGDENQSRPLSLSLSLSLWFLRSLVHRFSVPARRTGITVARFLSDSRAMIIAVLTGGDPFIRLLSANGGTFRDDEGPSSMDERANNEEATRCSWWRYGETSRNITRNAGNGQRTETVFWYHFSVNWDSCWFPASRRNAYEEFKEFDPMLDRSGEGELILLPVLFEIISFPHFLTRDSFSIRWFKWS